MNPAIIVAILGAGGIGAVIAAIVTGLFSKRKLGAEAAEIITKAAAGVVTSLQGELARANLALTQQQDHHNRVMDSITAENQSTMRRILADHTAEMQDVRRVLQLHVAWDAIAIARLGELGVDLPPAPPLLPPTKVAPKG